MSDPHHSAFELIVNGENQRIECASGTTLLEVLRDDLGLTGAKFGCGIGYCGACTVLVDDVVAHACCLLAATLDGRTITSIEGLSTEVELDPVQEAFLEAGAIQCGFCTPGFVMSARGLLDVVPEPTEEQARAFLTGNICRCTGFASIVRAVGTGRTGLDK
jgi:carbon-monoxide dehydrogenase small subunit|tara:strand:- start:173 stop:655 length:483 start_codon:yes stop_codon:yes gene_type:complete